MAIKRIPVPFCDVCKEPWLPKHRLADGTVNPVFTDPSLGKRCGKCKRTGWNAGGVDRRRKQPLGAVSGDKEAAVDSQTLQDADEQPASPPAATIEDAAQVIDAPVKVAGRCKHMLYKCPQCHSEKAA